MQRRMITLVVVGMSFIAAPASAIVVTGGAPATAPSGAFSSFDWRYVYRYNNSSAVAISPNHILTAGHVANDGTGGNPTPAVGSNFAMTRFDDGLNANQTFNMTVKSAFVPPIDGAATNGGRPDIAIIEFEETLPYSGGHYNLASGALANGDDVVFVGWGVGGNTGTNTYSSTSTVLGAAGTKRWGTNEISGSARGEYSDTAHAFSSELLLTAFNNSPTPATPFEAGVGSLDSGGGMFVFNGSEWVLAGINVVATGPAAHTGTGSVDLTETAYQNWINTTIPEPSVMTLLATVSTLLLRRRTRR